MGGGHFLTDKELMPIDRQASIATNTITSISMRDKSNGWKTYLMAIRITKNFLL